MYSIFIFVKFRWNLIFPNRFCKNIQMTVFMKILPVEAEFFRADRQKDRHNKPNSRFSQFYEHV